MKVIAAGKAKNGFGLLIDTARAEPVTIEKHGRAVVVVMSVEEYERLKAQSIRVPELTSQLTQEEEGEKVTMTRDSTLRKRGKCIV